ncbi:MAG: tetratricopeptide repeat protein [Verrucomicrobiota bacterium]
MNVLRPILAQACLAAALVGSPQSTSAQQKEGFDPQAIFTIMAEKEKAETLAREEKHEEAVLAAENVLAVLKDTYGEEHIDVMDWQGSLGNYYLAAGNFEKALPTFEAVRDAFLKKGMTDDIGYLEALSSIARCHLELADYDKAAEIQQQCLTAVKERNPPSPDLVGLHASRMGMTYWQMGDRAKALPHYITSLESYAKIHGDQHSQTAISRNNLGTLYMELGKYDEALPLLEKSLEVTEPALGFSHPNTIHVFNNLGELYYKRGDYVLALATFQRSLMATEQQYGPDSAETAAVLNHLGRVQSKLDHIDQATALFGRSYDILQSKLGNDRSLDPKVLGLLGGAYHGLGQADDAEIYYKRSLASYEEQRGAKHPYTREARERLAEFYNYLGRFDDAASLQ